MYEVPDREVDDIANVHELLLVPIRLYLCRELDDVMARLRSGFGGEARWQIKIIDVVNGHGDLVLGAPVLGHLVEPGVIRRDEVAPLQDRQLPAKILTHGRRRGWGGAASSRRRGLRCRGRLGRGRRSGRLRGRGGRAGRGRRGAAARGGEPQTGNSEAKRT